MRKAIIYENGQIAIVENATHVDISDTKPVEEIDLDELSNSEFYPILMNPDGYKPVKIKGKLVLEKKVKPSNGN